MVDFRQSVDPPDQSFRQVGEDGHEFLQSDAKTSGVL